ncbi:MAG: MarR family winged helix-turn-helix transcriptional regulator [Pseudomonadota bacterium]
MEVTIFKNLVWDYTRKIVESIGCVFGPVSENHGLTMLQTRIIMELHQCGAHSVGSLADSTCVAGANISAMCKKLEGQGLVERVRNKEDERVVLVALTRLGMETAAEIDKSINNRMKQCLADESDEALENMIKGLEKLNELLQKMDRQ